MFTKVAKSEDQLKMMSQMLIVVLFDMYYRLGSTKLAVAGGMVQLIVDFMDYT